MDIAKDFNISVSTLSTILKDREKIMQLFTDGGKSALRNRAVEFPEVDKCVFKWFVQCRDQKLPLSGPLVQSKAKEFAEELKCESFKASCGWFSGFKKRHGINFRTLSGESESVDIPSCGSWKSKKLSELLKNYRACDVFNADEAGLYFKCLPKKSLTLRSTESGHGGKCSKERLTLLFGVNMDGSEKLLALIIGKSKKPRCFAGMKSLPIQYDANCKA